jgi:small subunit ribosomal protein S6
MPTNSDRKNYELTFILDERAQVEEGLAKAEELKKFIAEHGGEVTKEEHWGRRELAYVIKRNRTGFYVTMWLSYPSDQLAVLDEQLRFDESIIRSLVTLAYTDAAQPGSLYPVPEEEKPERAGRPERGAKTTAEEELRRTSGSSTKTDQPALEPSEEDALPEEERLKILDETLDALLKDDE